METTEDHKIYLLAKERTCLDRGMVLDVIPPLSKLASSEKAIKREEYHIRCCEQTKLLWNELKH